jgi:hypothetical protein
MVETATVAVAAPPTSPVPTAAGGPGAVVVEILDDDDIPPPGWDQWASAPVSAPEATEGALVARGDAGVALGCPADGARPAGRQTYSVPDPQRARPAACLEQEREHADAPPAHFIEAQAEQGLWEELRDHGASLNWALNEALRIHSGPTWRVFQVSWASWGFEIPSLAFSAFAFFLTLTLLAPLVGGRSWSARRVSGTMPSTAVKTKIWYRKESDLWVQPGEKIRPGERRFLQKDSAKEPAVGNLLPFSKETVCVDFVGLRDDVSRAEGTNGWISDRT